MTEAPLRGYRVLDFSWVWSGPMVAAILAEFGAEVIKVEHGKRLDNSRLRGRPIVDGKPMEGPSIELNPYFHQTNHGKRSITLNLKEPRAIALLHALAAKSQVVIENLSVGALARAGLGYEALAAVNPRIIYLSMSAAGQTGPLREMRAYAPIMSSYTGLEALVGYPGEGPTGMLNFGYGDPNAGAHALVALMAAIWHERRTGEGQLIDMAQIEAMLSVMPEPLIDRMWNGRDATPRGNAHPLHAPHGNYPVAGEDRWIAIAVTSDDAWRALRALMGAPDWAGDARLDAAAGRIAEREAIDRALAAWTATQDGAALVERLAAAGIAAAPVLGVEEQWAHPQFESRGLRQAVVHPHFGSERIYATPWRMSATPPRVESSAPILGQDNDYVLGEVLGLPADERKALAEAGVIS
ncbi:MAG: CaiB/BaiF CoA transferase family protein [Alphaproteobacteria bacterium]